MERRTPEEHINESDTKVQHPPLDDFFFRLLKGNASSLSSSSSAPCFNKLDLVIDNARVPQSPQRSSHPDLIRLKQLKPLKPIKTRKISEEKQEFLARRKAFSKLPQNPLA